MGSIVMEGWWSYTVACSWHGNFNPSLHFKHKMTSLSDQCKVKKEKKKKSRALIHLNGASLSMQRGCQQRGLGQNDSGLSGTRPNFLLQCNVMSSGRGFCRPEKHTWMLDDYVCYISFSLFTLQSPEWKTKQLRMRLLCKPACKNCQTIVQCFSVW